MISILIMCVYYSYFIQTFGLVVSRVSSGGSEFYSSSSFKLSNYSKVCLEKEVEGIKKALVILHFLINSKHIRDCENC